MTLATSELEAKCEESSSRVDAARARIREAGSGVVALSGGVDSAFVLKLAAEELKDRVVALTADSPALQAEGKEAALQLVKRLGVRHFLVRSSEVENPDYARNAPDRCYFCKSELYALCERKRKELGLHHVFDGQNADDLADYRPGRQAARENGVVSPLAVAGLSKLEIRAWSRRFGLASWDQPAMPCLASRFPYGTAVTRDRLAQVGGAESELRRLGLTSFRVRFHGEVARLEVAEDELVRFAAEGFREEVNRVLRSQGFKFVALDLEPFRSGRLNEAAGLPRPS